MPTLSTTNIAKFIDSRDWSALHGADLRGADLREADLHGADLHGANLRRANLREADLRWANLHGANLYGANLHGANLYGANLHGANLRRANLRRANLREADLRGANIIVGGFDRRGLLFYGYEMGGNIVVHAGCRKFLTIEEAREHWQHRHLDDPLLHADCLSLAERIAKLAPMLPK